MKIILAVGPETQTKKLKKLREEQTVFENKFHKIYYLNGLKNDELINKIKSLKTEILDKELEICFLLNFDERNYDENFGTFAVQYTENFGTEGLKGITFAIQNTADFLDELDEYKRIFYQSQGFQHFQNSITSSFTSQDRENPFPIFLWKNTDEIQNYFNNEHSVMTPKRSINTRNFYDFLENKGTNFFRQSSNGMPRQYSMNRSLSNNTEPIIKHHVIITGSTSEELVARFMQEKFSENWNSSTKEYDNGRHFLYVDCTMHRQAFDENNFISKCNQVRHKLAKIILIENLNPRPETLQSDLCRLVNVFDQAELRKFLEIHFTVYVNDNMNYFKTDMFQQNFLFNCLGIEKDNEKFDFINRKTNFFYK